jgi:deazaflavin-dependent oxidoreductase (nitroreductase family)
MVGSRTKWRLVTAFQRRLLNPLTRPVAGFVPGFVLLETRGRRTGIIRRTPVGARVDGTTVWVVSEHGRRSGYVNNIRAHPRVRVRVRGRWRTGTAHVLAGDIARSKLRWTPNDLMIRLVATDPTTVRIDLDPEPSREAPA